MLSPAGARAVTKFTCRALEATTMLLSPAGARVVTASELPRCRMSTLLSPAGARAVTLIEMLESKTLKVAVPRRGASCYRCRRVLHTYDNVAVPRRGASCYDKAARMSDIIRQVAVPRRGASCYGLFGISYMERAIVLLSPAGARAVTAKMRKIQCGFSAFLQSFCIIFCIFAYPFVILSVFPGANLPVTT